MAKEKSFRPKARRPRGFEDRAAHVIRAERAPRHCRIGCL